MDPTTGKITFSSSRQRTVSQVSFTIGDSSDSESVSTATSGSVVSTPARNSRSNILDPSNECEEDEESGGGGNVVELVKDHRDSWHKYHFHDDPNGNHGVESEVLSRMEMTAEKVRENEELQTEVSPLTFESTRMVPDSDGDFSMGKLADVDAPNSGSDEVLSESGKWRILIGCGIVQFFSALNVSLQAPFYPAEAEKKGASAMEYCFVFGVYELIAFMSLPFFGSKLHKWRPKLVFNLGIFTAASASIIFGMLDKVNGRQYFIASCALARSLEGLGESALVTASLIIVASAFSDSIAPTIAILETFYGIGWISGPIVGSFLYQVGGFSLPFLVLGGLLLLSVLVNFFVLPSSKAISNFQNKEPIVVSSYQSFKLLGSASLALSACCILIGAMSISYLQATLEPHLRQFSISQLSTGAIFIINGGVYALASPFLGLLCDKTLQLKLVTFCGCVLLIVGFALVGPLPVFPFQPKLWIICMGLSLQGLGLGTIFVSTLMSIHRNVIIKGLPDTPSTYASVSCFITSLFSLGSFIGATLSGVLYDAVGFSWGTISIIGLTTFVILLLLLFICTSDSELNSFIDSESESQPLLSNNSVAPSSAISVYSEDAEPCTSQTAISRWDRRQRAKNTYGSMKT